MDTKVRERLKEYLHREITDVTDLFVDFEIEDLRDEMLMDFYYSHVLFMILRDMKELASRKGFGKAYEHGKAYLYHYAGYGCLVPKSEHPMLHTSKAYDILRGEIGRSVPFRE